ncbi:MAG: STAS domain-containing protein [Burkholderiaceae bacterium]
MTHTLSLPAELTIYTVGELRPQWLSWLAGFADDDAPADASVDGSAVDQIDAAGVQLLMALSRSLAAAQRSLQFLSATACSPPPARRWACRFPWPRPMTRQVKHETAAGSGQQLHRRGAARLHQRSAGTARDAGAAAAPA